METVFFKILNMSITATWLVLAVIVLRLLFKKAPKSLSVFLWALVGIRLICPFSFESALSLVPSAETVPQNIIYSEAPAIDSGVPIINSAVNDIITENLSPEAGSSANPLQIIAFVATVIWIVGILIMIFYTIFSYLRIKRKVRESVQYDGNIWLCDHVDTPFILGIIRPRIYLPSNINKQDVKFVIEHEKAHLKRCDHLWKPLGFLLLTIYWFNPVLWLAYAFLCKDIELACDEKVVKEMGSDIKKFYSNALINCSAPRKTISACPLAFGEVAIKDRVKSVLNYKKPAFWIVIITIITTIAVTVCFLTNPKNNSDLAGNSSQKNNTHSKGELSSDETNSSNTPVNLPKEPARFIGKTVGDVKSAFGDDFKFDYYKGANCMKYMNLNTVFILDGDYINPTDSCKIGSILSNGDTPLIDNLSCNLTYSDLVAQLGTSVITEEPSYWHNEMAGYYNYTLIFIYKDYKIMYTWLEDPATSKAISVEAISPQNKFFKF